MIFTIKNRLIVFFLLTSLLPMILLGGLAYMEAYRALSDSAQQRISREVGGIAHAVETSLEDTEAMLINLATTPIFVEVLKFGNQRDKGLITSGNKVLRDIYVDAKGVYENMLLIDLSGKVKLDSWNGRFNNQNLSQAAYIQRVIDTKGFVVSMPTLSTLGETDVKLPSISMAYPVRDQREKVIGVLAVTYDLNYFTRHLYQSPLAKEGKLVLIDEAGYLLYHPDNKKVMKRAQVAGASKLSNGKQSMVNFAETQESGESYGVWSKGISTGNWRVSAHVPKQVYLQAANIIRTQSITVIVFASIVCFLLSYFTIGRITRSMNTVIQVISKARNGDLTVRAPQLGSDEIGEVAEYINDLLDTQKKVMQRVLASASMVDKMVTDLRGAVRSNNEDIKNISDITRQLSEGAEANAQVVTDVDLVLESFAVDTQRINRTSSTAADSSKTTLQIAAEGDQAMQQVLTYMEEIDNYTRETGGSVHELFQAIEKVLDFVKVIHAIADQTNLLALNAAIEAARAGEQGRSFGVVAEQVRALSEQSATATKEINETIRHFQQKEEKVLRSMSQVGESVSLGVRQASTTATGFRQIVESINLNVQAIEEVQRSMEEQAKSVGEISQKVHRVQQVTWETTAGTTQIADRVDHQAQIAITITKTAEGLKTMAANLHKMVGVFNVNEEGLINEENPVLDIPAYADGVDGSMYRQTAENIG